MKRIFCGLLAAAMLLGGWTAPVSYTADSLHPAFIRRVPEPTGAVQGKLNRLPLPDENGAYDLRDADLTECSLQDSAEALQSADFTTATKWPQTLPEGFDPAAVLEQGKDPGLGVRKLHQQGITGRGVGIGIIDQTLLVGHQEYKDQLRYYNEHGNRGKFHAEMHGPAVSSIAVGKTVGVAPDALLYYIADSYQVEGPNFQYTDDVSDRAKDIDEFIALNETLPEDEKIRVISISNGWMPGVPGADEMDAAVARARNAGIAVVWISDTDPLMSRFLAMGRKWMADPNDVTALCPVSWMVQDTIDGINNPDALLTPIDARTLASNQGEDVYAFYRYGGMSWAMPYVAGLYALAWQCRPGITFAEFVEVAEKTAIPAAFTQDGKAYPLGLAVNPEALMDAIAQNDS